ncbi:Metallo-dependent phosphatase [Daldinia caldariorum]|uniref:Metallo-dependent phosphatase n=1 Tax=Daldinia caldariorum TaxID=326644 RepID=UPI00200740E2|nr:Metallo-dependent phosphatase [Daldinia caldariorum]KAI1468698.1 Metallo-dependent phosphatase [Daldinia caldariorum]
MGLLVKLGLRRRIVWKRPTILDWLLEAPLQGLIFYIYHIVVWLRSNRVGPPQGRRPINIVCLSDTHESIVQHVPDGDLLIHCGDLVNDGRASSIQKQIDWLDSLPHRYKVVVCGNHDSWFDVRSRTEEDKRQGNTVDMKSIHYLEHESITFEFEGGRKLNIYGAPGIPRCGGSDNAFQYTLNENPWEDVVPIDTDILITHTPPRHHLDLALGCPHLLREIWRKRPRVHMFGHVHCGRGMQHVFWDECQTQYETAMSRPKPGLFYNVLDYRAWLDVYRVLYYGVTSILWHWLFLGGVANRSILINAGMQDGTRGRLTKKAPITITV